MVYQNAKLERMPKFLRNRRNCRKKNRGNEVVLSTDETNASTFDDTKQNDEHVLVDLTESTHDSSSIEKRL